MKEDLYYGGVFMATKKIGFIPCVATAIGIVVSSSALTLMGSGFGKGGTAFLISMIIAAFLNLCVAFSFAELSGILPAAGGINHYTLPAMGYGIVLLTSLIWSLIWVKCVMKKASSKPFLWKNLQQI